MANCNHDCGSCSASCGERQGGIEKLPSNGRSNIKKVIGVVSGKGGVGKSSVTSMLAVAAAKSGKKVAILDADITGPSIPRAFGIKGNATGEGETIYPLVTELGIKVISINLLLEDETEPVVWRGPILGQVVQQFWKDVVWEDIDVMFVDMPPGTGDVALTVYQSLPIDGIVVVTTPQSLVSMIVEKAAKMAKMMNVPILGIVENMSYFACPDCGTVHHIFGDSHVDEIAREYGVELVTKLPINPNVASLIDQGRAEDVISPEIQSMEFVLTK